LPLHRPRFDGPGFVDKAGLSAGFLSLLLIFLKHGISIEAPDAQIAALFFFLPGVTFAPVDSCFYQGGFFSVFPAFFLYGARSSSTRLSLSGLLRADSPIHIPPYFPDTLSRPPHLTFPLFLNFFWSGVGCYVLPLL